MHQNTITVSELIQKLSTLPPDAVIVFTTNDQNGAWSSVDLQPRTVALNTERRSGFAHQHYIIEDHNDIAEHIEDYPNDVIVEGFEICL